ncbi:hypothetical protein Y1Q_0019865 [Alligator mississippiensis]|uniref:Gypsy retrotransposon integrase-like protein 1 n=1 Tax=Alligator mississippiensis TaxID=8496 RepID=A0A151PFP7_ALLMI|nr:hypothetical protein Y1Q_0019865 [Alligator mississippiensis]
MLVGVTEHLPYPVVLGCNWPELLEEIARVRPEEKVEGFEVETEQMPPEEDTGQEVDVTPLWEDEHFQLNQSQEADFRYALQEHLAQRDGEVLRPELMNTTPRFEVKNGLLYRIERGKPGGKEVVQLLVPQRYQWAVLKVAHELRMGGHLGRDKSEARIRAMFFWPGLLREVARYCTSCPMCQKANPRHPPKPL